MRTQDDTTRPVAQASGRARATGWAHAGWGAEGWGAVGAGAHGGGKAARREEGSATPTLTHPQAREVPGVKVFRSSATVYFANAELYSDTLKQKVRLGVPRVSVRGSLTSTECPHPLP